MIKFSISAIAISIGLAFSAGVSAHEMSKVQYKSAKRGIATEYKSAAAACIALWGSVRDGGREKIRREICQAEAKGERRVAKAELEARYSPSNHTRHKVNVARAKAGHLIARKRCNEADQVLKFCLQQAKAVEVHAMADAAATLDAANAAKVTKETSKQ
jgi:hypothetical protein